MEKKIAIIVIICCNMIHAHCNMTHAQNINFFYNRGERQYWTVDSTSINLIVADTADLPWIYQNAINYLHGDAEGYYSDEDDNLVINSRLLNGINVSVFLYSITDGHLEKVKYYTYAKNIQNKRVLFRNEIAVKLKQSSNISSVLSITQNYSISDIEIEDSVFLYITCANESDLIMLANQLYESGLTQYSEPDFYLNYECYYNDLYYEQQYYLHNTGQSITLVDNSVFHCISGIDLKTVQAWDFVSNIENPYSTKVAIVDDGVENHEDLVKNGHSKVLSGFPLINRGRPKKCHAHGQCCAGIVAATSNNNKGIVGIDQNANIVPIRIALCDEYLSYFMNEKRIARGIRKSWQDYNSDILNLSFGDIRFSSDQVMDAIQDASLIGRNNKGCVVVAASGNDFRDDSISQFGRLPSVIAVGAVKGNGDHGEYSNYSSDLNVVAFGGEARYQQGTNNSYCDIYTTDRKGRRGFNQTEDGDYYAYFGMTSAAAPMVSGVASLMLSVNPNLTSIQVKDLIEKTAQKLNGYQFDPVSPAHPNGTWNEKIGYGLVDAHKAVVYAYMFGHDEPSLSVSSPLTCNTFTCSCDIYHPELFTYEWSCSSNLNIIEQDGKQVTVIPLASGIGTISVNVLSYGRVMYTKSITVDLTAVLATSLQPVSTTPITITNNAQWTSANMLLPTTLVVDTLATLTISGILHNTPSARLIVRPGGKLIIDGGTLTSACAGEMWQGIEVVGDRTKQQLPQYQGKVELLNGAVVENAWCGIRTGLSTDNGYLTTGGIITAESATFRNNRRALEINSYAHYSPSGNVSNYVSDITRCTFTVDNSNLFAANSTSFAEHVRLWDVKGVKFSGCDFSNTTTNPYGNGRGIYAEDAGFTVTKKCLVDYVDPSTCSCPDNGTVFGAFSGFTTAVEVNTTGNPYAVSVDWADFENNVTGVKVKGNLFTTVTRNTFNLDEWPDAHVAGNIGLKLDSCSGYKVEENHFERTIYPNGPNLIENSVGIAVANSGISDNSLYRNNYVNLTRGISVAGNNGHHRFGTGLQMTCNYFNGNKYDVYLASGATVCYRQGTSTKGADNEFHNTSNTLNNFYNPGLFNVNYYFYNGDANLHPALYTGLNLTTISNVNNCASTLCGITPLDPTPFLLAGFQSDMNAYTTATGVETQNFASLQQGGTGNLSETAQSLSDSYYTAVRTLMSDSLLDLGTLEQWHTAAQPIADPYSLTETRFCEGYAELFAADVDDAEMANYAEFHAMKLALRVQNDNLDNNQDNSGTPFVNWYALTPAQIAQLQTIAERNTGRASVMAKGVLCFFHGICYEDDLLVDDNGDNNAGTRAKRVTTDITDDAALTVYPNPTDDLLFVELRGAEIARVALYDLQGRMVTGTGAHAGAPQPAGAPQQGTTATVNLRNVPAGVYLLRVTDADGKEYHQKIVKR